MHSRAWVFVGMVTSLTSVAACHSTKHYEANVEITRVSSVRKDETGRILTLDLEMSYAECPGTQIEVIRGDSAFASCVARYKVGDKVHVGLDHQWTSAGTYEWVVRRVGECPRIPDPNDEASYALVRECDDWNVNGTKVGFQCKYTPEKTLLAKCPWFRKR